MHLPTSMLNGTVCPVTLAVGAVGVAGAVYAASKSAQKPLPSRFAAVTAFVFSLQMLNYSLGSGISGHLLGGMLGVSLLGVPFAVLSMSIVLAVQAFLFGDGGVNALGANVLNMALLGTLLPGLLFNRMIKSGVQQKLALAAMAFVSVLAAAAACAVEVGLSAPAVLNNVMMNMLSVHALMSVAEAFMTVSLVMLLQGWAHYWKADERLFAVAAGTLAVIAAAASPFASNFPDGLEWVVQKLSLTQHAGIDIRAVFFDYQVPFIGNVGISTAVAGVIGAGVVFVAAFTAARSLKQAC